MKVRDDVPDLHRAVERARSLPGYGKEAVAYCVFRQADRAGPHWLRAVVLASAGRKPGFLIRDNGGRFSASRIDASTIEELSLFVEGPIGTGAVPCRYCGNPSDFSRRGRCPTCEWISRREDELRRAERRASDAERFRGSAPARDVPPPRGEGDQRRAPPFEGRAEEARRDELHDRLDRNLDVVERVLAETDRLQNLDPEDQDEVRLDAARNLVRRLMKQNREICEALGLDTDTPLNRTPPREENDEDVDGDEDDEVDDDEVDDDEVDDDEVDDDEDDEDEDDDA